MFILVNTLQDLATICAQLVREGVTFVAAPFGSRWRITLTGGF